LNLHKTFAIPHGGGGPGLGPICAAEHLRDFLPGHPMFGEGAVSAAPFGSASILPISWTYIALMGAEGLTRATQIAILNANYMARRLAAFEVLYWPGGRVAHELSTTLSAQRRGHVETSPRLIDYGFHAPTMSFRRRHAHDRADRKRVEGEATAPRRADHDSRRDRRDRTRGDREADHRSFAHPWTSCGNEWPFAYTREQAAYPAPWTRQHKFWPPVSRIDNAFGDRNLVCTCPPIEDLVEP
jgi:glycine dehydrogenase